MNARELRRCERKQGCTFHTHKCGSGHLTDRLGGRTSPAADTRRPQGTGTGTRCEDQEGLRVALMLAFPITLEDAD